MNKFCTPIRRDDLCLQSQGDGTRGHRETGTQRDMDTGRQREIQRYRETVRREKERREKERRETGRRQLDKETDRDRVTGI